MTAIRSGAHRTRKRIALTYDDGPGPRTGELLDVLVEEGAGATFFLVGENAATRPDVVGRMSRTPGIEVGSHTFSHVDLATADDEQVVEELTRNAELLRRLTGHSVRAFRPPWGHHGPRVDDAARDLGHSIVLWSLTSMDWKHRSATRIVEIISRNARDGDIVLFHDTLDCTVDATRPLIRRLKRLGFEFVTASELLGNPQPGLRYAGRVRRRVTAKRTAQLAARSVLSRAKSLGGRVFNQRKRRP